MARFTPYAYAGRGGFIEPTKETIEMLEEQIRWCEVEMPAQLRVEMFRLSQVMAFAAQGFARKYAFGPEDPGANNPALAWKLPVRRITGRYYVGWKVRPTSIGWQLYNDSREAYFIEYGINHMGAGRRVRRPVLKLTLLKTLEFMRETGAYHRVLSRIMVHKGKGYGMGLHVQSPPMGTFNGPVVGRRLP